MSLKYNPHSIEKQARKWPVLFSAKDITDDLSRRTAQLWEKSPPGWLDPFSLPSTINSELREEFGVDACRIAQLSAGQHQVEQNLLESAYRWLNNFFAAMNEDSHDFTALPWLEAALQIHDQVLLRHNQHAGLALLRKAFKTAKPGRNISQREKNLVISTLYPFAPVLAGFFSNMPEKLPASLSGIHDQFSELIGIRFALARGGWHWKVFARQRYQQNPVEQLRTVKWVESALGGREVRLEISSEGTRICFN